MNWIRYRGMICSTTDRARTLRARKRFATRKAAPTNQPVEGPVEQILKLPIPIQTPAMHRLPSQDTNGSRMEWLAFFSLSFVAIALIAVSLVEASRFALLSGAEGAVATNATVAATQVDTNLAVYKPTVHPKVESAGVSGVASPKS